MAFPPSAAAHSASDAYLTLDVAPTSATTTTVHAQWDIALRDLDFVIRLDDDGDGKITWQELQRHQDAIARYALAHIRFVGSSGPCGLHLTKQLVDNHADGAYAALFFDVRCSGTPSTLAIDYRLFFALDPSHRAIVVSRNGNDVATALLSPLNPSVKLGATAKR